MLPSGAGAASRHAFRFSEPVLLALLAAILATLWIRFGPPGTDAAAHVYQRSQFIKHGFTLWDNLWYAGRYSIVTYSLGYYPAAALLGIGVLAVVAVAGATYAFAALLERVWGRRGAWPARTFAVVWSAFVLTGAFPFALGLAFALLALLSVQTGRPWRFCALTLLAFAASPLVFVLLLLALLGILAARWQRPTRELALPAGAVVLAAGLGGVLALVFPSSARFPFPLLSFVLDLSFCVGIAALGLRSERSRALGAIFAVLAAACVASYLVASPVGANIGRLQFLAAPIAVLACALRDWRPRSLVVAVLALATFWNLLPLWRGPIALRNDPSFRASYWAPAVRFLGPRLGPGHRVEVVGTAHHWEAAYLPEAGLPIARGWFRQDDFVHNQVLYGPPDEARYSRWLHRLAVRYVVVTDAPLDGSARWEAALARRRGAGLRLVRRTRHLAILAVPHPSSLVTGPGAPRVTRLQGSSLALAIPRAGRYRIAVTYSPYWVASSGCLRRSADGMLTLAVSRPARERLTLALSPGSAWRAVRGQTGWRCAGRGAPGS